MKKTHNSKPKSIQSAIKSKKRNKKSRNSIPPQVLQLPSESYLISVTREDRRKRNGGCKPKDPVWNNYYLELINKNKPPKNDNIRSCKCKFCCHVILKNKHPIKVSTLRTHGLKCTKTPKKRKDIIRNSINKLQVKNALFTIHKSKNNIIRARTSIAHPLDVINPILYSNIVSDNDINKNNTIRDLYNINIERNTGRICVGNISNSNNTNGISGTRKIMRLLQTDLDKSMTNNNHTNQQEKSCQSSLPSTLPISTPSLSASMPPVLNLEIMPSLEQRFPDAFLSASAREFDGHTTYSIKQEKKEDEQSHRLNNFDTDYQKKYELQHEIDNQLFWFTIENLCCYNQWEKDRFCKIIQLIIDYGLATGDTYAAPNGYQLRNGVMKQNLELINFKVDQTIYESGSFGYYCDEGGPNRQGTFISIIRAQQTNFVADLSVTGLYKKSLDLLEIVKRVCSPYIAGNCVLELFLSDSTNKMVKLRRLVKKLYHCIVMGGIEHVGQNIVDLITNLPQFKWLYKEMKVVLNTMFNTGFIFILKEKLGLDVLDVLSKPWCSNPTEWNKPFNMGDFLLKLRRAIGEAMIDERSSKYFELEVRQNYMNQSAHYNCISLSLSYYKPWKICMMQASRKRVYLSDLLVMYTQCMAAVDHTLIDRAGGDFVVYENIGNGKEEKEDESMECKNETECMDCECKSDKDDVAALFVTLYGIAKRKYVSNANEISYDICDVEGNYIRVSAEYHISIVNKVKKYFVGRWTKHIYRKKVALAFFLDIVLRKIEIIDKEKYFVEASQLLNDMISSKIGGNKFALVAKKLMAIHMGEGAYGRGLFDISHLSADELITFDRALPYRQHYAMCNNDIIGKEIACVGIKTFNLKPVNVDIERVMKGFNYVTRDLQLHKSLKLKFNEIYIRHNLKSLQELGKI